LTEVLSSFIIQGLSTYGFGLKRLLGVGYDGYSARIKGVLMLTKDKYPKALFFHCASHQINLVNDLNDLAVVHNTICTETNIIVFLREFTLNRCPDCTTFL
jgi:hypothetical protein